MRRLRDWERLAAQPAERLLPAAAELRDRGFGNAVTFSKKVFIPLTQLCRNVCHYCTFAKTPRNLDHPFLDPDRVLAIAREGAAAGCKEALFTLGDAPELRYRTARDALDRLGYPTTVDYVIAMARAVREETGLLPHVNAGILSAGQLARLRRLAPSMGLMLESSSPRLCRPGMPHHGSLDKVPARRLDMLKTAGELSIPMTTGLLVGFGETRLERLESFAELLRLQRRYGHIQEIIIQNFKAKPGTKMSDAPDPPLAELLWSVAAARLIFGQTMSIQAPPNLSPEGVGALVGAGINDLGGISPVTPDHVNPESPWPALEPLSAELRSMDRTLTERVTIYPDYIARRSRWLDPALERAVLEKVDGSGLARTDPWRSGSQTPPPADVIAVTSARARRSSRVDRALAAAAAGNPSPETIVDLFAARGRDFSAVCSAADVKRRQTVGADVTFVVNRNINYTNLCTFRCGFCAFSKGNRHRKGADPAYDIGPDELARRVEEAWARGATEVCLQGGIHPSYSGKTYLDIVNTVREAAPDIHIHAFSPLEVVHGATTLGLSLESYLERLKQAGLRTLPGTAAEILDDEVRAMICPDKLDTATWLEVMETAHRVGLRSTATIMFGHVDAPRHWANHLLALSDLQSRTGGFTELVPLPFVPEEAPIYRKGKARPGPTFREAVLMHAVARLVLPATLANVQVSWVKLGLAGALTCLQTGANDVGGTLMNESISRAAGADHGQELAIEPLEAQLAAMDRPLVQRDTLYQPVAQERRQQRLEAPPLTPIRYGNEVQQRA